VSARVSGLDSSKYRKLCETINYIKENYAKDLSLRELAEKAGLSPYYLEHLFKKELGVPVMKYINRLRVEAAKELLRNTDIPVTQIAYSLGWNDSNYFSNVFRKETGLSPLKFRKGA
jgi:YesN/AraC family two-component response regulator